MKCWIGVLVLSFLAGCQSIEPVPSTAKVIDIPPIDYQATAELGDTIIDKGIMYSYDAIVTEQPVAWGDGIFTKKMTVPPGTLIAREQNSDGIYYYSDRIEIFDSLLGTMYAPGGIYLTKDGTRSAVFRGDHDIFWVQMPGIKKVTVRAADRPSFRQELIYNGRVGTNAKFLYRETSNEQTRAPLTQEMQYDLSASHVIGFKGARVEVVEASNTQLTYRVLGTFTSR